MMVITHYCHHHQMRIHTDKGPRRQQLSLGPYLVSFSLCSFHFTNRSLETYIASIQRNLGAHIGHIGRQWKYWW